jgi:hypothetical protein
MIIRWISKNSDTQRFTCSGPTFKNRLHVSIVFLCQYATKMVVGIHVKETRFGFSVSVRILHGRSTWTHICVGSKESRIRMRNWPDRLKVENE